MASLDDLIGNIGARNPTNTASGAPLFNEYNLGAVKRQAIKVITGGIHSPVKDTPWYIWLWQVFVFILPPLFPAIFLALEEAQILTIHVAVVVGTILPTLATLASWLIGRKVAIKGQNTGASPQDDPEDLEFFGWLDGETLAFIFPPKATTVGVLSSLVSGAMWALVLLCSIHALDSTLFPFVEIVVAFSIISAAIAQYSLTTAPPPESAVYNMTATRQLLDTFHRPIHIILFLIPATIAAYMTTISTTAMLLIPVALLPLLWILGIAPPPSALLHALLDQYSMFGVGASPRESTFPTLVDSVVGTLVVLGCYLLLLLPLQPKLNGAITFATVMGAILATDLSFVPVFFRSHSKVAPMAMAPSPAPSPAPSAAPLNAMQYPPQRTVPNHRNPWHSLFKLLLTVGIAVAVEAPFAFLDIAAMSDSVQLTALAVTWVLVGLTFMLQRWSHYYFGGFLVNPLHKSFPRAIAWFNTVSTRLLLPAFSLILLTVTSRIQIVSGLHPIIVSFGLVRSYRAVLQHPHHTALQLATVVTLLRFWTTAGVWSGIPVACQLTVAAFFHNRLTQFANKLKFFLVLLITSWTDKTQHKPFSLVVFVVQCVTLPITASFIALAAILNAPIVSFVGLPVVMTGFPRPQRFWPSLTTWQTSDEDAMYYIHLLPSLRTAFKEMLQSGKLGSVMAGDSFIFRLETKTIFLTVTRVGFNFISYSLKGLELTETSCHTIEASYIESALENASAATLCSINKDIMRVFQPLCTHPLVTYADSTFQLTGLIDSPDFLPLLRMCFTHSFAWHLLTHIQQNGGDLAEELSSALSLLASLSFKSGYSKASNNGLSKEYLSFLEKKVPFMDAKRKSSDAAPIVGQATDETVYDSSDKASRRASGVSMLTELLDSVDFETNKRVVSVKQKGEDPSDLTLADTWDTSNLVSGRKLGRDSACGSNGTTATKSPPPHDQQRALIKTNGNLGAQGASRLSQLAESVLLHTLPSSGTLADAVALFDKGVAIGMGVAGMNVTSAVLSTAATCALRSSFKLALDMMALGETSLDDFTEFCDSLEEVQTGWFIGPASGDGWQRAVLADTRALYSLAVDSEGVYRGRMLTSRKMDLGVFTVNPEALKSTAASLALELLFLLNDDEERYSIQANQAVLRNLSIQACEAPLGYPIFAVSETLVVDS
eukprot:m.291140 g.291140  ORF g.291140 m.291140 type:complete len:1169 (-) comp15825_c0_seq8:149-3655(-)